MTAARIVDRPPMIFADTLALGLLGGQAGELVGYHRAHGSHVVLAGARGQVTGRSRYAEEALAAAVGRGVSQYVLLGAGLDSFAYRSPLAGLVTVFEVDHPASQRDKRGRLAAARGEPWLSELSPGQLDALLRRHGWTPLRHVRQWDIGDARTWRRSDALRPAELTRIVHAVAGSLSARPAAD